MKKLRKLLGWQTAVFGLLLAACTSAGAALPPQDDGVELIASGTVAPPAAAPATEAPLRLQLPDQGPAPDFANEVWLNADGPISLASLQGKVVLVEFWTFG